MNLQGELYLSSNSSDSEHRRKDRSFSTSKNNKARKCRGKNDDEYLPKKIPREKIRKEYKKWSIEEEKNFLKFLKAFEKHFETKESRRFHHVFEKMAETFPTRNAKECKSHYQYLTKITKQGNIRSVIMHLEFKNNRTEEVESEYEIEYESKIFKSCCEIEDKLILFGCKEEKTFEMLLIVNMEAVENW